MITQRNKTGNRDQFLENNREINNSSGSGSSSSSSNSSSSGGIGIGIGIGIGEGRIYPQTIKINEEKFFNKKWKAAVVDLGGIFSRIKNILYRCRYGLWFRIVLLIVLIQIIMFGIGIYIILSYLPPSLIDSNHPHYIPIFNWMDLIQQSLLQKEDYIEEGEGEGEGEGEREGEGLNKIINSENKRNKKNKRQGILGKFLKQIIRVNPQLLSIVRSNVQSIMFQINDRLIWIPSTHRVLIDVSDDHEFRLIYDSIYTNRNLDATSPFSFSTIKHINSEKNSICTPLIIDCGAFDGLFGSNSYNWLELGWDGLLIEALPASFSVLNTTITNMISHQREHHYPIGKIELINAAISAGDFEERHIRLPVPQSRSAFSLEVKEFQNYNSGEYATVLHKSVIRLFREKHIPKHFGILSVDIEKESWNVVKELLVDYHYRPCYLICETKAPYLSGYEKEQLKSISFLDELGYVKIATTKMNVIWMLQK